MIVNTPHANSKFEPNLFDFLHDSSFFIDQTVRTPNRAFIFTFLISGAIINITTPIMTPEISTWNCSKSKLIKINNTCIKRKIITLNMMLYESGWWWFRIRKRWRPHEKIIISGMIKTPIYLLTWMSAVPSVFQWINTSSGRKGRAIQPIAIQIITDRMEMNFNTYLLLQTKKYPQLCICNLTMKDCSGWLKLRIQ